MKEFRRGLHYLLLGLTSAIFFGFQSSAHAIDAHPTLMVVNLKASPNQSQMTHQLYLRVSEYDSNGITRTFTVPHLRLNWPKHRITQVDNLQIWGGALSEEQATSLVVSIMEKNAAPWGTDNLLGVLNLKIKNESGKLLTKWTIPNTRIDENRTTHTNTLNKQIQFFSEDSNYTIDFALRSDYEHLPPKNPRLLSPHKVKHQDF
jgi:hypothetical protein